MPQWNVQAPDGKVIAFPDNFTEADVNREMGKMYGGGQQGAAPTGTIAPTHATYLEQLEGDVRHGTSTTVPGKILQMMGARGTDTGVSPGAAEQGPGSLPLGMIKAAQGIQEGSPLKAISGVAQAATIPAAFMGGPAANNAVQYVPSVAKEQAGQKFAQVMSAAGNSVVDANRAGDAALNVQQLASRGGSMPKVVRDFLRRVTDPQGGPLTYSEARDFYSNATQLSANEAGRLNPKQVRALGTFTRELGSSLQDAAAQAGQGDQYAQAMSQYRYGAQGQKLIGGVAKAAIPLTGVAAVDYVLRNYILRH